MLFFYKKPKTENFVITEIDNKIEIREDIENKELRSRDLTKKEIDKDDQPGKGKNLPD